jgi:hypothetical protein
MGGAKKPQDFRPRSRLIPFLVSGSWFPVSGWNTILFAKNDVLFVEVGLRPTSTMTSLNRPKLLSTAICIFEELRYLMVAFQTKLDIRHASQGGPNQKSRTSSRSHDHGPALFYWKNVVIISDRW